MRINKRTGIIAGITFIIMLTSCSNSSNTDKNNSNDNTGHSDNFIAINNTEKSDNTDFSADNGDFSSTDTSSEDNSIAIETNSNYDTDGNMENLKLDDETEETKRYKESLRTIISNCVERHKNNGETQLLNKYKTAQSIEIGNDTNELIDNQAFNDIMSLCIPSGTLKISIDEKYQIKEFEFKVH